jgi:uncharacterized membrane protein YdjX (TVP38/TMEM64 family)
LEARGMNRRSLIFRSVLVTALAAAITWLGLHRELLQPATIERELQRFGGWAPILFLLLYALATVLFVPGSVLTVAGGALFGPIWGTLWNLTGATLGATLAFVIARYVASDWVAARSGERLGRLMRGVEEEGWRFVAFVRLVPLFPFNLMNYAFGLTRIRLREYVLASLACMAPGALAYSYLGYAGREAAFGQAGAIRKAMLALALLAAVAFLPRLVRRVKGQRFTDPATLKGRLESGEEATLIDVRSAEEFRGPLGHIAGASNIPIAELSARIRELTEIKRKPIITV